jgi:hypothetical protein
MENWKFCLQRIYCKCWNNYIFTVQHSPRLVQCTYSRAWQAHRFLETRILSDGCATTHVQLTEHRRRSGTAFYSAHLSMDRRRKTRRRKVGWVRRLWDALKPQFLNSRHCWCNRMWLCIVVEETHFRRQKPAPFLANSWLQIFPQNVWVGGIGHSASCGHVVLYARPVVIPEESQHIFACRSLHPHLLRFRGRGVAPIHACRFPSGS